MRRILYSREVIEVNFNNMRMYVFLSPAFDGIC